MSQLITERLVRFGCAAKGFVYFVLGLLALQLALGDTSLETNTEGALHAIAAQPFGRGLLIVVACGLVSYALWRLLQAIFDPRYSQLSPKRVVRRLGYLFSALSYGGLSVSATRLVWGIRDRAEDSASDWTAKVLMQPFGRWLVGTGGGIFIVAGLVYLYLSLHPNFRKKFHLHYIDHPGARWAMRLGRFGIAARGFVFGLIGFFLVRAAWLSDSEEAKGLDQALHAIVVEPRGQFFMAIVAIGFIAYSIHMLVEARYRRLSEFKATVEDKLSA